MTGEYASWRKRAQQYRALAATARTPRAQQEYNALAASAEAAAAYHAKQAHQRPAGFAPRRVVSHAVQR